MIFLSVPGRKGLEFNQEAVYYFINGYAAHEELCCTR